MWVNLHTLPADKAMYTIAITTDPKGTPKDLLWYDEVDYVGPRRITARRVVDLATDELDDYPASARVVGVSNQSDAYVMWENADDDLRAPEHAEGA